jgi:hypothetical protein
MPTTTTKSKASGKAAGSSNGKAAGTKALKPKPSNGTAKAVKPAKLAKPAPKANESALGSKLGIVASQTVVLIDAPTTFPEKLEPLPDGVELRHSAMRGAGFDLAVLFVPNVNTLNRRFSQLAKLMRPQGSLWVAFPKRGGSLITDLTEDAVKPVGAKEGLADNKVISIDATWSAMRFVAKSPLAGAVITEIK